MIPLHPNSACQAASKSELGQVMMGVAALIASLSIAVLVFVSVPAVMASSRSKNTRKGKGGIVNTRLLPFQETARAMREMAEVTRLLRKELLDTLAVMRLAGMELADCAQEFSELGVDLLGGVRSAAGLVTTAEAGVKSSAQAVGAIGEGVCRAQGVGALPVVAHFPLVYTGSAVRSQVVPSAREALEEHLKKTAELKHAAEALAAAKTALRQSRAVMQGLGAAGQAAALAAATTNARELQRLSRDLKDGKLVRQRPQDDIAGA